MASIASSAAQPGIPALSTGELPPVHRHAAAAPTAAYLASLAASRDEPSFAPYTDAATPLLSSSLLYGWLDDSMQLVVWAAEGEQYRADIEPLLPATAGVCFAHYATADSATAHTLQRTLNVKANASRIQAAVQRVNEGARGAQGDKRQWAHHKAITAQGAWGWKVVKPECPQQRLADVEYAVAARLNLDLAPFPARAMEQLPERCPLCTHQHTGAPVPVRDDPWHWLSCRSLCKVTGQVAKRSVTQQEAQRLYNWTKDFIDSHSQQE